MSIVEPFLSYVTQEFFFPCFLKVRSKSLFIQCWESSSPSLVTKQGVDERVSTLLRFLLQRVNMLEILACPRPRPQVSGLEVVGTLEDGAWGRSLSHWLCPSAY